MRSMTGFGRSQRDARGVRAIVEVKSLNHKGLDIKVRLPRDASALEPEIISHVKGCVERGRVDVNVELLSLDAGAFDLESVQKLVAQARSLAIALDVRADLSVGDLMRALVIAKEQSPTLDIVAAQPPVLIALDDALGMMFQARTTEGQALSDVVEQRLTAIEALGTQLRDRAGDAPRRIGDKLRQRLEQAGVVVDPVRLVQEIALIADRADVHEELERLTAHIAQGRHLASSSTSCGRQLEFLCQELLREANTLGSKCQDAPSAHLVVELKTEIERLREQVQNVE